MEKNYDPINLPEEFEEEGTRVDYTLKILEDQASIHMWGIMIEIIKIDFQRIQLAFITKIVRFDTFIAHNTSRDGSHMPGKFIMFKVFCA